jgi:hypothetical protein
MSIPAVAPRPSLSNAAAAQVARLNFLQDSARLLYLSSPSTSRTLMVESVAADATRAKSSVSFEACASCGSLLLLGSTASRKVIYQRSKKPRGGKRLLKQCSQSLTCRVCGRISKAPLIYQGRTKTISKADPATDAMPVVRISNPETAQVVGTRTEVTEKPTKHSSKQRAKVRKDRAGLQSLLNQSAQHKVLPSLGFMDLMKK